MPRFSTSSERHLSTCDERIVRVLYHAIKRVDFVVICGHRTKEEQDKAVAEGKSKVYWPNSKHNLLPSLAVDVAPYVPGPKIDWNDICAFARLAGYLQSVADEFGTPLRWGGDWDGDWRTAGRDPDEKFLDAPHLELTIP